LTRHNYRQVKRQKEEARKARQLQKQQRRGDRVADGEVALETEAPAEGSEPLAPAETKPA
jgi:hypothetical protein